MQQLCCEEMDGKKWLIYGGRQAERVSLFPIGRQQFFFLEDVLIHAAATSEDTVGNAVSRSPLLFGHFLKCLHLFCKRCRQRTL